MTKKLTAVVISSLGAKKCWLIIVALFASQALWIALSARYPMAFDEDFHLGIITIYAQQWLPFLDHLPDGAGKLGGVIHDPSYLYHYLMSFPYRVVDFFTHDLTAIVIVLRLINVGLATAAFVLFRKVLLRSGLGRASAHSLLIIFALIPIVPLLAGQINYDNLLLLLIAWICLLTLSIMRAVQQDRLPVGLLIGLLVLCLLASLVKYAFLPVFMTIFGFLVVYTIWQFKKQTIPLIKSSWRQLARTRRWLLCLALILSLGLFAERYGVNTVLYHTPIPDCGTILDDDACMEYGPWNRDRLLIQNKSSTVETNPLIYTGQWLYGMWYRLFFTLNGNADEPSLRYQSYPPLPVIGMGAILLFVGAMIMVLGQIKRLFSQPLYVLYGLIVVLYCGILWMQNYLAFIHTGTAVAVNGRYLLIIAIPLGVLLVRGTVLTLRLPLRAGLAVAALIVFLQGGGVLSFMIRSSDPWYWNNQLVRTANHFAQDSVRPLVVGSGTSLPITSP